MDTDTKEHPIKHWIRHTLQPINQTIRAFSITEKIIFTLLVSICVFSGLVSLYQLNKRFLVAVPDFGGNITEGIIGSPRFINPLLAISDADRDVTSLVYSGLLKANPQGSLIPDLALKYEVSEDQLTYTFTLKDNITFHDGVRITTEDIEFTIQKAQDAGLKSPRRSNWDGVRIQKIDERTIAFTLKQPYSPFIQNATIGILPKHIWKNVPNESFPFSTFNNTPIGSGPYKIDEVKTNDAGLPVQYILTGFKKYILGRPYISTLTLNFYPNEKNLIDALQNETIESASSISPQNVSLIAHKNLNINTQPLPRIFGIFFNQNESPIFINKEVREALNRVVDKQAIIQEVLAGYGQAINGPLHTQLDTPTNETQEERIVAARNILESSGWKLNSVGVYEKKTDKETEVLRFSISTSDAPELKSVAQHVQKTWQQMGAQVEVKIFEIGDLNQNVIRPRKYETLLFGEILGRELDLYPFWHSSQRNDPGINIGLYTNQKVDTLLEAYRKTIDEQKKNEYLEEFKKEIANDTPAVFIYSPYFIYVTPKNIKNIQLGQLTTSGERFLNIHTWYIHTNNVWKIFIPNN